MVGHRRPSGQKIWKKNYSENENLQQLEQIVLDGRAHLLAEKASTNLASAEFVQGVGKRKIEISNKPGNTCLELIIKSLFSEKPGPGNWDFENLLKTELSAMNIFRKFNPENPRSEQTAGKHILENQNGFDDGKHETS